MGSCRTLEPGLDRVGSVWRAEAEMTRNDEVDLMHGAAQNAVKGGRRVAHTTLTSATGSERTGQVG